MWRISLRNLRNQFLLVVGVIFVLAASFALPYGMERLYAPVMGQELCHSKNVYWESRSQPFLGQWMVAYVTANRAKANRSYWGGKTLCGVVYKKNAKTAQFSWVLNKELTKREPSSFTDKTAWKSSFVAARLVGWTGLSMPGFEEATFYMNPDASNTDDVCWFRENLISLGFVGDHEFFREPHDDEVITFKCEKAPVAKEPLATEEKIVPIPQPRPA